MVATVSLTAVQMGLSWQCVTFLLSLLLGSLLGALYDVFRITRKAIPLPGILIALEDLLYFLLCSVLSFVYLMEMTDGRIRWFVLVGELFGAVIYRMTLSCVVMALSDVFIRLIGLLLLFCWGVTGAPLLRFLRWVFRGFQRLFIKNLHYLKKEAISVKNSLKQRRHLLYNSNRASGNASFAKRRKRGGT